MLPALLKQFELDEFIAEHNYCKANQIQFLSLMKSFILDKGTVEKEDLIAPPVTDLHRQGIRGVFSPKQLDQVLAFISEMGQRTQQMG